MALTKSNEEILLEFGVDENAAMDYQIYMPKGAICAMLNAARLHQTVDISIAQTQQARQFAVDTGQAAAEKAVARAVQTQEQENNKQNEIRAMIASLEMQVRERDQAFVPVDLSPLDYRFDDMNRKLNEVIERQDRQPTITVNP